MTAAREFAGTAFPADGSFDGRSCRLSIGGSALAIESGKRREDWKFGDLMLGSAGAEGEYLLITPRGPQGWLGSVTVRDPDFCRELAAKMTGRERDFLLGFSGASRAGRFRKWRNLAAAAILALGVLAGGYWAASNWAAAYAARHLPVELEVKWGRSLARTQLAGRKQIQQGPAFLATQEILGRLKAALPEPTPYPLSLNIAEDDKVNAFALPGGQIVIMTGLIKEAAAPEEVAGVLAHEMQHILKRHVVKRLVQGLGWRIWLSMIFGGTDIADLAFGAGHLLELSYGREQEQEADIEGARLLAAADLPIEPLADFFSRLAEKSSAGSPPAFLSTHPLSRRRAENIRALAREIGPKRKRRFSRIDWAEVRDSLQGI